MADPLSLLRVYNINKKEIIRRDDQIIFAESSWPKDVKTNYMVYGSGKDGSPKEYYTLECLMYLLQHIRLTHAIYVREAASAKIPVVRRPDRRDLLAYLAGETVSSTSIDKLATFDLPLKVKRPAEGALDSGPAKKPKLLQDKRPVVITLDNECVKKSEIQDSQIQKAKEQLAAKLDTPKERNVSVDNIISLSEAMSVEKIATIKAKRLAKKRTTIKRNDDIEIGEAFKDIMDMDADDTQAIISRERQGRTRITILQTTDKDLAKYVFDILKSVGAQERAKLKGPVVPTPRTSPKRSVLQYTAYDRYDQQRFIPQNETTDDFVINTMGTYHGMTLQTLTENSRKPLKPTTVPTKQPAAVSTKQPAVPHKRTSKTPIIIVPGSDTSLITMYNARDILQDFKFVSSNDKKAQAVKRETEFLLQRRKDNNMTVPYLIVDNPLKLTKDDWARVVAVFVVGPTWQFKGWPFVGGPVEIFSKISAFHIKYDEMPINANVARWAVTVIQLSKTKRHLDRAAISIFWEVLDRYIIKNKSHLRF